MDGHGWAAKKKMISRTSKTSVSSFWKYIFLQKINVGKKNTNGQRLISFRKIQPCELFLQAKETLIISSQVKAKNDANKRNLPLGKSKDPRRVSAYVQSWPL